MVAFIDEHREIYGVEPICACCRSPRRPVSNVKRNSAIRRGGRRGRNTMPCCARSFSASGMRTIRSMARGRSGSRWAAKAFASRGAASALDARTGLRGRGAGSGLDDHDAAIAAADRPRDLVDRHFAATRPNQLWVSDFTYVATWRGFVYVAFVIDVFARRIVGWRVSVSLAHRLRARCARAGDLRSLWRPRRRSRASQRSRHAVSVDALHRSACRCRYRAVGRQSRRFVRQRARRIDHRPL